MSCRERAFYVQHFFSFLWEPHLETNQGQEVISWDQPCTGWAELSPLAMYKVHAVPLQWITRGQVTVMRAEREPSFSSRHHMGGFYQNKGPITHQSVYMQLYSLKKQRHLARQRETSQLMEIKIFPKLVNKQDISLSCLSFSHMLSIKDFQLSFPNLNLHTLSGWEFPMASNHIACCRG